jgi:hypothetical protein
VEDRGSRLGVGETGVVRARQDYAAAGHQCGQLPGPCRGENRSRSPVTTKVGVSNDGTSSGRLVTADHTIRSQDRPPLRKKAGITAGSSASLSRATVRTKRSTSRPGFRAFGSSVGPASTNPNTRSPTSGTAWRADCAPDECPTRTTSRRSVTSSHRAATAATPRIVDGDAGGGRPFQPGRSSRLTRVQSASSFTNGAT